MDELPALGRGLLQLVDGLVDLAEGLGIGGPEVLGTRLLGDDSQRGLVQVRAPPPPRDEPTPTV